MPVTQKGIYHNLRESKYRVSNGEILFFFSSEFYLNKFMDRYKEYRQEFKTKLKRITDVPFNTETLADITLYQVIEKRGFYVRLNRIPIKRNDLYNYALRKMNDSSSFDWGRVDLNGEKSSKV
jgi:hypothetical protein